jgi:hypothetical protein
MLADLGLISWETASLRACLRVRIGLAAIFVRQSSLHPGNQTVGAGLLSNVLAKFLHAIVLAHRRRGKGSVADHDPFGFVLGEELWFQYRPVGICALYVRWMIMVVRSSLRLQLDERNDEPENQRTLFLSGLRVI